MLIKREGSFINMITLTKEGTRQNIPLRDVRGSISWPSKKISPQVVIVKDTGISEMPTEQKGFPMYFGIFAQKQEFGYTPRPPVVLVEEYYGIKPMTVFQQMVETGRKYECGHFYADLRAKNDEIIGLFNEFSRHHQNSFVHLEPADLAGDFMFGVGIAQEWDDSLEIPKESILGKELARVSGDNLNEADFPALNALRLLLSSLERSPWVAPAMRQQNPDPDKARRRWSAFT